ncbi:MAG TPA: hypothetical protein ACFYD4_10075 [Candidatus Wunengus sp. YC61]|uniref:hypothetical protein n=1 Tax=Candidatus Wunengus sp. YC61 TaxID=3367698 RepID=UPI004029F070
MIKILSLGAGVQSSTLVMMMEHGEIPKADAVVFADTGSEPAAVYRWLDWLKDNMDMPYLQVQKDNGLTDNIERVCGGEATGSGNPPLFTENGGMIHRQCTGRFKISPIRKAAKVYKKCIMIRGISWEERRRANPSDVKWITHEHPLVDMRMSRTDCKRWMVRHGYPIPPRSACVYCPYRCNLEWRKMRDEAPEDWAEACRIDDLMRDRLPGMKERVFVHRSCVPLRDAPIDSNQINMFEGWEDCEGLCGV